MPGSARERSKTLHEGPATVLALLLLAAIAGVDAAAPHTTLISLLVVVPLLACLVCPPRFVALIGALTLAIGVAMGAVDDIFGAERHLVGLLVIAAGATVGVAAARIRTSLAALRDAGEQAFRRIALLDRSSQLMSAPMEVTARLERLAELPVPAIADLCIIDLTTADGRLEGVVVAASEPDGGALVNRSREIAPIDPAGEHPVAVALRTGRAQLREAMTDADLSSYAASPEHLGVMRRLAYRSAVVVPLVARGRTLGVLSVLRLGSDAVSFDESDVALMTDLAGRAAVAIDTSRLFERHQRAEARLQTVLDGLAEAVVMVSREGDLVYLNDAAAGLFGHATARGMPPKRIGDVHEGHELFGEDGRPLDVSTLPGRRVLRGEPADPVTYRRRNLATGVDQWLTVKASAVSDPATGEPLLAVNVIEDITVERRAREAAAFLSEATKILSSSMRYEENLQQVTLAAVPQIADACAITLLGDDGRLLCIAQAPAGSAAGGALELDIAQAAATGETVMRTTSLVVPMTAAGQVVGAIALSGDAGRPAFAPADMELAEELGRRAGVAVQHARVHRERSHVAATLQRSLLPPRLPVVPGLTLAARFRAAGEANQVGGDFYDLFQAPDGWIVVIGDVAGKGAGAAAITSLARYTIRTAALYEPDPAGIVRRLNDALLANEDDRQMCTAVCLKIVPGAPGEPIAVRMVCAGHPPPFLLRAPGELEELCRPGPLLGAFSKAQWTTSEFALSEGDSVVLYTDGVTDARGTEDRFGQKRLEELLRDRVGQEADAIAEALDRRLQDFQQGPQPDDVAVLVLRAGSAVGAESSLVAGSAPG